ncbi:MAG: hypothetical protein PVH06_09380 [Methyloceanibacter sp.]|jgi:hypothetical protein
MAAMITFGFVPLAFLLFGVHFVSPAWQNGYVLITGLFVVASVPASWTFRNEAIYRIEEGVFEKNLVFLGFRIKSWKWPKNLFEGISYGNKGLSKGRASVVRLRCKVDDYLVDSYFYANSAVQAQELAQRLSEVAGLPVLGKEFTGQQHELNDLRRHAWLTKKYGRLES